MFRVAICVDELHIYEQLKNHFTRLSSEYSYHYNIQFFKSGEELIHYYIEKGAFAFQILILDIEMDGINGLEVVNKIRFIPDHDVQIMFLSSHPKHVMDSFDVQTFQYLLKPIDYELFKINILKLCSFIQSSTNRYFTIKSEREHLVLRKTDVIAIVKVKHSLKQNKLTVITANQQYIINGTLSKYVNTLDATFMYITRSIIINLEHVRRFTSSSVIMSNNQEFPLSRSQAKKVKDLFTRYTM
ncbi:LytTR family DNA-binding domain-containing protein [Paenibacillus sp. FSL R7-0345]|uniref:LytR/AlgR family response regulator transcription factor n=1 Tax=Paenibacillus sp. FSL R7-0345 TaxID=2954535 RepID=UPI00315A43AE